MKDKAVPIGNWECRWDGEHAIIATNPGSDNKGHFTAPVELVFNSDGGFCGHGKHGTFCNAASKEVNVNVVGEEAQLSWQWIHGVGRDGQQYTMFQHPVSGVTVEIPRLEVKRIIVLMPLEDVRPFSLLCALTKAPFS